MERVNYITCPKGHKVFVIWSDERGCFGFTCDECGQHSEKAISLHGTITITVERKPFVLDYKNRASGERE